MDQLAKARRFRELHAGPAFVIANAWDGASARILAGLGFAALATSSGAQAATLGRLDGKVSRAEALAHARVIVEAVDVPVSADLEKGFGDSPDDAAETIRQAAAAGLVGGSIEDATGNPARPLFAFEHAVERVAAAAEAAHSSHAPFMLTARTENYLRGKTDLDDTIARLQAFERAGADVLFAPGLPDLATVRAVCAAVTKPVNFMVAIPGKSFTVDQLVAAGVKRISLATTLYRVALAAMITAAQEIRERGTFEFVDRALSSKALADFLKR
jgi:2-methylisocitrate lyase-like PEP mutase family enzyme